MREARNGKEDVSHNLDLVLVLRLEVIYQGKREKVHENSCEGRKNTRSRRCQHPGSWDSVHPVYEQREKKHATIDNVIPGAGFAGRDLIDRLLCS